MHKPTLSQPPEVNKEGWEYYLFFNAKTEEYQTMHCAVPHAAFLLMEALEERGDIEDLDDWAYIGTKTGLETYLQKIQ